MKWVFRDDKPVYQQIIEQIKKHIASGKYPPASKVLSVREFAEYVSVNPNTMQRALSILEAEGLIITERNSGRYITQNIELIEEVRKKMAYNQVNTFVIGLTDLGYNKEEIISLVTSYMGEFNNEADN